MSLKDDVLSKYTTDEEFDLSKYKYVPFEPIEQEPEQHHITPLGSDGFICYISDIHIEYQLFTQALLTFCNRGCKLKIEFYEILYDMFEERITQMIADKHGTLLIAGDTADSIEIADIFYSILASKWRGIIVTVLGNNEIRGCKGIRTIEEVASCYKDMLKGKLSTFLLENELLVLSNIYCATYSESSILNMTDRELSKIIADSELIILGGNGFTGYNDYYNAEVNTYGNKVTTLEEDRHLSDRFHALYNKVLRNAGDTLLIVLTHTPIKDWSADDYRTDCIYVSGHNHTNTYKDNVFADNQIGRNPTAWKLNAFTVRYKGVLR